MNRDEKFDAISKHTKDYDGKFYCAVKTTGIFCLPSCSARPNPENVDFFDTYEDAVWEGYRPCKRCKPDKFYKRSTGTPAPVAHDYTHHYDSPLGGITLASDGENLIGLWFDHQKYFADALRGDASRGEALRGDVLWREASGASEANLCEGKDEHMFDNNDARDCASKVSANNPLPIFTQTCKWLDIYFGGSEPDFTPPLRLRTTPFRREVGEIMLTIPYGKTMTYGEIAKIIAGRREGASKKARKNESENTHDEKHTMPEKSTNSPDRRGKKRMSAQAVGGAVGHNSIGIIIPCHRVVGASGSLTGYAGGIDKKIALLELEGTDMSKFFVPKRGTAL